MQRLDGNLVVCLGLVSMSLVLVMLHALLGVSEARMTRCVEQRTAQLERLTSCTALLERTTDGLRDCDALLSRVRDLDGERGQNPEQACICFDPLPVVLEVP